MRLPKTELLSEIDDLRRQVSRLTTENQMLKGHLSAVISSLEGLNASTIRDNMSWILKCVGHAVDFLKKLNKP